MSDKLSTAEIGRHIPDEFFKRVGGSGRGPDGMSKTDAALIRKGAHLVDEDRPYREAYRLERVVDGVATVLAKFYTAKEALTVIPSLDENYRIMLGDRQIGPNAASSRRHTDTAN